MELVLATRNSDKIREIKKVLEKLDLEILTFKDLPDFPSLKETGISLRENALLKARALAKATGKLSLADDSGLEVEFLNGAPGVYSSRFAGEKVSYQDNNKKLLSLLKDVPDEKRGATFRCVMALADPRGKEMVIEGVCPGKITTFPRGKQGFGYDPIFQPEGLDKTFAEISLEEKNRISHRAKALFRIKEILEEVCQIQGKFLIGLTGNMGCGKTMVAKFLEKWGLKVINADEIGHMVLKRDDVKRKMVAIFGSGILNSEGEISRKKLRQIVATDKEKLTCLNKLLHPLIKKKIWNILKDYNGRIMVIEAALIFEANWDFFMNKIITVYCSKSKQMERLRKNTSFTPEEIKGLLRAQLPQEEKIKRADFVISNEAGLRELETNTRKVLDKILEEAECGR